MITKEDRNQSRQARHIRVRKRVVGTPERPRLNVFRSNKHIYAQVIDDETGTTLVAASTLDSEVKERVAQGKGREAAKVVGELVAARAKGKGISRLVFDRGGYLYHGRVAALADGARAGGIEL